MVFKSKECFGEDVSVHLERRTIDLLNYHEELSHLSPHPSPSHRKNGLANYVS